MKVDPPSEPEREIRYRQMFRLISRERCHNIYGFVPMWFTCPGLSFEFHYEQRGNPNSRIIINVDHLSSYPQAIEYYLRVASYSRPDGRILLHDRDLIEEFYEEAYYV